MEILKTQPGGNSFHWFQNFPDEIYPPGHHRFNQADNINTDFLDSCFVLLENRKVQARAALYHNTNLQYRQHQSWCIGNYEAKENPEAGKLLLLHIMEEARTAGARYILGPMNGSTWDNYRFQLESPNPDFFMEPVHHQYYHEHFRRAGFSPIASYFSCIDRELKFDDPAISALENDFKMKGVRFRNIRPEAFEQELEKIYHFNAIAFQNNFLFTPVSPEAFLDKQSGLKNVIMPEFTILAEDRNQDLIAYFFCIEDFLNTKEKCLIVKTLARHPDDQWKGLGHVIGNMIYERATAKGYTSIIHALVYEGGTSIQLSKNFSGENYKNYVLYGSKI